MISILTSAGRDAFPSRDGASLITLLSSAVWLFLRLSYGPPGIRYNMVECASRDKAAVLVLLILAAS